MTIDDINKHLTWREEFLENTKDQTSLEMTKEKNAAKKIENSPLVRFIKW